MAGVGIAVEQLDGAATLVGAVAQRVINALAAEHRAHRHDAVGDPLGHGDQVRHDVEVLGGEAAAQPAEAGDDLVEDQQDAVPVADFAQALQVALGRDQHAGGPGHRLDDDRRDGLAAMQRAQPLQIVGQVRAPLRLAARIGLLLQVEGVAQVVAAGQLGEDPAVVDDAADRDAAEADPVVAALAPDQAPALTLAAGPVVGQRDLQGAVHRFRAGVGEEDMVVGAVRGHLHQLVGKLEGDGMAELEAGRVVEPRDLALHRLDNAPAVVAGVDAPQARRAVQDVAAVEALVVHAVGAGDQLGMLLELAVPGERHPVGFEVVRRGLEHVGLLRAFHGASPSCRVCRA